MMSMSIVQLLEEIRHCPESVQDEETRLWHSWLFEGTRVDIEIPLWESAYRDDRKVLLDQVTLDVAMCYYAEHLG